MHFAMRLGLVIAVINCFLHFVDGTQKSFCGNGALRITTFIVASDGCTKLNGQLDIFFPLCLILFMDLADPLLLEDHFLYITLHIYPTIRYPVGCPTKHIKQCTDIAYPNAVIGKLWCGKY